MVGKHQHMQGEDFLLAWFLLTYLNFRSLFDARRGTGSEQSVTWWTSPKRLWRATPNSSSLTASGFCGCYVESDGRPS